MTKARFISLLKIAVTTLVVIFSIYFSIWKVDFTELGRSFETADYGLALTIIPVILFSHLVRSHRWKVILERVHPAARVSNLFAGVIVGYFMNNLIPRSGELARPYVTAQREEGSTFSGLLGTIVMERFIDIISLLAIVAVVLLFDERLFEGFEEFGVTEAALKSMIMPVILFGLVFLVLAPSRWGLRIAELVTGVLPGGIRERILSVFRRMQEGFGAIRTVKQTIIVVLETVVMYFLYMLPLYIMFFAFESAAVSTPTMFDAIKILALTAIAFAVAPTPGAFGVFHITARIAIMKILDFSYADAVAYATITHFINYMTVMIPGGYYLVRNNISLKELVRTQPAESRS